LDAKADLLVYWNCERQICEIAHRLAAGEHIRDITDLRGTAFARKSTPEGWVEIDSTHLDTPGPLNPPVDPYAMEAEIRAANAGVGSEASAPMAGAQGTAAAAAPVEKVVRFVRRVKNADREHSVIRMPSFEQVANDPVLYAHASRILHLEANPGNARVLVQRHGKHDVWINPPPVPLTTPEMDALYELPFQRVPHPRHAETRIPA